jgi:hypothetical protein
LEDNFLNAQLFSLQIADEYFTDNIEFLITGVAPREFNNAQKKNLVVRVVDYKIIVDHLYNLGADRILRICVMEHEIPIILAEAHEGIGNYAGKPTTQKILCIGLRWPMVHMDAKEYFQNRDLCQRVGKLYRRDEMSLRPQVTLKVFYNGK